jgi:thiopurine S-methyltransferase
MDKAFWQERWQRGDTAFHQPHIHDQLKRLWPAAEVEKGSTVFVPLAGKSRDMVWLADQGHKIIGVELSEIAVADFFAEQALTPERKNAGRFEISMRDPYTLLRGDIFDLDASTLQDVAAVYDRAALVAFPPDLQPKYAAKLMEVVPPQAKIFLVSLDYPKDEIPGPPFATSRDDVHVLFGAAFSIELLESRDGLVASDNLQKRGVTRLDETAYLLRRRA